jgi:hypothetical protein
MNEYIAKLYDFISSKDSGFASNVTVSDFAKTMSENEDYAKEVYSHISRISPDFGINVDMNDYLEAVKKKDATASAEELQTSTEQVFDPISGELLGEVEVKPKEETPFTTLDGLNDVKRLSDDVNLQQAARAGAISYDELRAAGVEVDDESIVPTTIPTTGKKPVDPDKAKQMVANLRTRTQEEIDYEISTFKLDQKNPYIESADPFINDLFRREDLIKMGINPDDFSGFLKDSGYKSLYEKRVEDGIYESGTYARDESLTLEMDKSRMIEAYIVDRMGRDVQLQKKLIQKDQGINQDFTDNEYIPRVDIDLEEYERFRGVNFATLEAKKKELKQKALKKYQERLSGEANNFDFISEFASSAMKGINSRIDDFSASTYDVLGMDSIAEEIRAEKEQKEINSFYDINYSIVSGKKANVNGRNYIVSDNGQIYDTDIESRVTDFLDAKQQQEIRSKAQGFDRSTSSSGMWIEGAGVLTDLAVQIGIHIATRRGIGFAGKLAGKTKAGRFVVSGANSIGLSKEISSAMISQGVLGMSSGYEQTLKAAREAGISEDKALELASDAAKEMAGIYAVTALLNPRIKIVKALTGEADIVRRAVNSYSKLGKEGFRKVFAQELVDVVKTVGIEGAKELVQENVQQAGEVFVVNDRVNANAGRNIVRDTISVDEFYTTSILSFAAGGLLGGAGSISGIVKSKGSISDLKAISILSQDYEKTKSLVNSYAEMGVIDKVKADRILMDIEAYSNAQTMMPGNLTEEQILEITPSISKIVNAQNQKKDLDPAFHDDLDLVIEQERKKIKDALQKRTTEEVPVSETPRTSQKVDEEVQGEFLEVSEEEVFELEDGTLVRAVTLSDGTKVYETANESGILSSQTVAESDLKHTLSAKEFIESEFGSLKTEEPLDLFSQPEYLRRPRLRPQEETVTVGKKKYFIFRDKEGNVSEIQRENGEVIPEFTEARTKKGIVKKQNPAYTRILSKGLGIKTNTELERERKQRFEEISTQVEEAPDAYTLALNYLAKGFKLNKASVMKETGMSAKEGMWVTGKNTDPTVEQAAERIWGELPEDIKTQLSDSDIRDGLIDAILSYGSKTQIQDELISRFEEQQEEQELDQTFSPEEKAFMDAVSDEIEALESMTDEEVMAYYEQEYQKQLESLTDEEYEQLVEGRKEAEPEVTEDEGDAEVSEELTEEEERLRKIEIINQIHLGLPKQQIDDELSKASGTTQVATTTGSYVKVAKKASQGREAGSVLDYGAGLGVGTDAMSEVFGTNVESLEVNPERWKGKKPPTYTTSDQIKKTFDTIVSLNVVNVVPKGVRNFIVLDIASKLNSGGKAYISSRKFSGDVANAKNFKQGPEEKSLLIQRSFGGKIVDVYQKGYDGNELVEYVQDLLGDGFTVEKDNSFGASGVVITKIADLQTIKQARFGQFDEDFNDTEEMREMRISVKNALNSLQMLMPSLRILPFNNTASFVVAAKQDLGYDASNSRAFFAPDENAIYVDLSTARPSTVAHEAFHAALHHFFPLNADIRILTGEMIDSLRRVLTDKDLKTLEDFMNRYPEKSRNEEFIVEFGGFLSRNFNTFKPKPRSIIKTWLNKIGKLLGFQEFTDDDVLNVMKSLGRKIGTGEIVTEKDFGFIAKRARKRRSATGMKHGDVKTTVFNAKESGLATDKDIRDWAAYYNIPISEVNKYINDYNTEQRLIAQKEEDLFAVKDGKFGKLKTYLDYGYRYFLSSKGFLPKTAQVAKEIMRGNVESNLKKARLLVRDLDREIAKYEGDKEVLINSIRTLMTGNKDVRLPRNIYEIALQMRFHVDALSKSFIDIGLAQSDAHKATIEQNIGSYLNRSYRVFDEEKWSPSQEVVEAARNYLRMQLFNKAAEIADATSNDVIEVLEDLVSKEISKIVDRDFEGSQYLKRGMEGAKKTSLLDKRLDIPVEIRALMGEYTDPILRYYRTVSNMSGLIQAQKFTNKLKESGLGVFLFEGPTGKYKTKIASEGTKTLDPLGGLYTTPQIAEALRGAQEIILNEKVFEKAFNWWLSGIGAVKYSKTILSVGTHAKNVLGNLVFMFANGYLDPKEYQKAFDVIKNDIAFGTDEDLRSKLREYIELGIISQSVTLQEIRSMFGSSDEFDKSLIERHKEHGHTARVTRFLKKAGRGAAALYQSEDDFFKIVSYEMEKKRYARSKYKKEFDQLTESEKRTVIDIASENTKNLLPNYSRIGRFGKLVRYFPVATFISFEMEAWRTAYNTADLAVKEIQDPNTREVGTRRLAGIIATRSLMAMVYGTIGALGFDDEDDEEEKEVVRAARKFLPDWAVNSSIVITEASDGGFTYRNISASDPWGSIEEVANAAFSGKPAGQALSEAFDQFVSPYVSEDILAGAVRDLYNTVIDGEGKQLWSESATATEAVEAATERLWKALEPGTITSAKKIAEAEDTFEEVVGQLSGLKAHKIDIPKQMTYKSIELRKRADQNRKDYISARYKVKDKEISKEEFERVYDKVNRTNKEIYSEAIELYEAGLKLGANKKDLVQSMLDVRIPKDIIRGIITGEIPNMKR